MPIGKRLTRQEHSAGERKVRIANNSLDCRSDALIWENQFIN